MEEALETLTQSTTRLAEAVLPAGTPAVAAIPAAMRSSDIDASRERLQGSIVKCNNGDMFVVPTTGGLKLARGKILRISTSGDEDAFEDANEAKINALAPEPGVNTPLSVRL